MNKRVVLSVVLALIMVAGAAVEASAKGGPGCRPKVVVRIAPPRPHYCAPAPVVVYRRPAYRRSMMHHHYYANHNRHNSHYGHGHHGTSHGHYRHR